MYENKKTELGHRNGAVPKNSPKKLGTSFAQKSRQRAAHRDHSPKTSATAQPQRIGLHHACTRLTPSPQAVTGLARRSPSLPALHCVQNPKGTPWPTTHPSILDASTSADQQSIQGPKLVSSRRRDPATPKATSPSPPAQRSPPGRSSDQGHPRSPKHRKRT